ncbi:MAG: VCBS repeat-containing protein [Nocardioidaceae bacterium]|nr:VCBS repeat-containing protein [Nocardioidaceae bacterium]
MRTPAIGYRLLATAVILPLSLVGTSTTAAGSSASTAPADDPAGSRAALVVDDRAAEAGLAAKAKTWSADGVDYNKDGEQDVWIGYHGRGGKLWRNNGDGIYRWVARAAWPANNPDGKTIDRHDCAWADVDRNGRKDAYCSTGRFIRNIVKDADRDNEMWMQSKRGRFHDVARPRVLGDVCGRGRHVAFLKANGDRWPDLFLGNGAQRKTADECNGNPRLPNERGKIFINQKGDGFKYVRDYWDYSAGAGNACAEVLDFDGDGRDDLFACQSPNQRPKLYRNNINQRRFVDVTVKQPELNQGISDAEVRDLDADGDDDLVTSAVDGFYYQLNNDGTFGARVLVGPAPGGSGISVDVGDADGDGHLDVYGMVFGTRTTNPDDVLYLNDGTQPPTFTPVEVPSAAGSAQQVVTLDPSAAGPRDAFLALNGFGRDIDPGKIQLLRMVRDVATASP